MSSSDATDTPSRPDLAERARVVRVVAHERRHVEGGRQPGRPCSSRKRKRLFVSSGVPKPANIRIVHGLPRYIVSCTPRV